MADNAVFAARIRELRLRAGLSQRQAAIAIGRRAAVWQGWEAARAHPRSEAASDIARALGLPIASLYAPKGWTAIAELLLSDAVLERIKRDGEPYATELAAQYAQAVIPAMLAAASKHGTQPQAQGAGQRIPRLARARTLSRPAREVPANAGLSAPA